VVGVGSVPGGACQRWISRTPPTAGEPIRDSRNQTKNHTLICSHACQYEIVGCRRGVCTGESRGGACQRRFSRTLRTKRDSECDCTYHSKWGLGVYEAAHVSDGFLVHLLEIDRL